MTEKRRRRDFYFRAPCCCALACINCCKTMASNSACDIPGPGVGKTGALASDFAGAGGTAAAAVADADAAEMEEESA